MTWPKSGARAAALSASRRQNRVGSASKAAPATRAPPGAFCTTIPGQLGSDCVAFTCPPGYEIVPQSYPDPPICRMACPGGTMTVDIAGPTAIQPGAQCTWTAVVTGGSGSYTFDWFNQNLFQGNGQYYSGGRLSGSTASHFWLRVNVWDGYQSKSNEILVAEDPSAPICII